MIITEKNIILLKERNERGRKERSNEKSRLKKLV